MTSRPASAVPDRMGLDVPVEPVAAREGRPLPRRRSAVRVGPGDRLRRPERKDTER
ncbi:hypothetical protein BX257_0932 [Streptomyces sp. 3212.3]|jgi:hypothetical protein|nr:hypothetical protein BX257_0932 [Streptomyces sp. 3212.3]